MKNNGHVDRVLADLEPSQTVSQKPADGSGKERRKSTRHPITASVEAIELETRTRLTGRATDLSLGGCYVDVISPFAEKSAVRLRVSSEGHSFITPAVVTYSLTGMGMGLMFVNVPSEQAAVLRKWVAELSGDPAAVREHAQESAIVFEESPATRTFPNLRDAALELVALLVRKQVLTESEAQQIRGKLLG